MERAIALWRPFDIQMIASLAVGEAATQIGRITATGASETLWPSHPRIGLAPRGPSIA